jgi:hypothetical protein
MEAIALLSEFSTACRAMSDWHTGDVDRVSDLVVAMPLFSTIVDYDMIVVPALRWGASVLPAMEAAVDKQVDDACKAVLDFCPPLEVLAISVQTPSPTIWQPSSGLAGVSGALEFLNL